MQDNLVVGVDVGGTKVAAGLVDCSGKIHAQSRTPMVANDAARGLAAVCTAINDLLKSSGMQHTPAIGICAPGPLNPTTGIVINPQICRHGTTTPWRMKFAASIPTLQ